MGIEHVGRLIILNGTSTAVEAETAALAEIVFGRNSATGAIGYSVDDGATWTWLDEEYAPISHTHTQSDIIDLEPVGNYRQFTYIVSGGDFSFVIDEDGEPIMALQELET